MRLVFLLLSVIWTQHLSGAAYDTDYDQAFTFTCGKGEYIQSIESVHSNHYEDRVFKFGCKSLKDTFPEQTISTCEWSPYENSFDHLLEYQCTGNRIISGISSYHDNHYEDRRFKFYCCHPGNPAAYDCAYTAFVNAYDALLSYRVPDNFFIRGITSTHDNSKEDRIFKFDICKLAALGGPSVG
ncbi:hemagglutinin/amebocyte aggregation factor [Aplysia californica]|uniref:Hemagglutinin/amebocyte aggregation factor n=1 Tax=Aplysia californica TaxID=6500 RepID=A0ABM1A190_APLCA|nr:hemagglutinin/amebocyte aggregation factor [Aplysia californica]